MFHPSESIIIQDESGKKKKTRMRASTWDLTWSKDKLNPFSPSNRRSNIYNANPNNNSNSDSIHSSASATTTPLSNQTKPNRMHKRSPSNSSTNSKNSIASWDNGPRNKFRHRNRFHSVQNLDVNSIPEDEIHLTPRSGTGSNHSHEDFKTPLSSSTTTSTSITKLPPIPAIDTRTEEMDTDLLFADKITPKASGSNAFPNQTRQQVDYPPNQNCIVYLDPMEKLDTTDQKDTKSEKEMEDAELDTDANLHTVSQEEHTQRLYPNNIDIGQGSPVLLSSSTTFTDDTQTNAPEEGWKTPNMNIMGQNSVDTFETPNSRTSRASSVRFQVPIDQTPGSFVRKPPSSLVMDEHDVIEYNQQGLEWNADMLTKSDDDVNEKWKQMGNNGPTTTNTLLRSKREQYLSQEGKLSTLHSSRVMSMDVNDPDLNGLTTLLQSHVLGEPTPTNGDVVSKFSGHLRQESYGMSTIGTLENDLFDDLVNSEGVIDLDNMESNRNAQNRPAPPKTFIDRMMSWWICQGCFCKSFLSRCSKLSWNRVSVAIVRHAPCFWCSARRSETGGTDRITLIRLIILCALFATWQLAAGCFILVVSLSETIVDRNKQPEESIYKQALSPNLWSIGVNLLILSIVGLVLLVTIILAIPAIRQVNLLGAIRFMWVLFWILPLQIFLVIALIDYHNVTEVWIKHWWENASFAWFRSKLCEPETANTLCAAPYAGGSDYESITEWCQALYQSERCEDIRKAAEDKMLTATYFFFYLNAILGGVLLLLLLLSLGLLHQIISFPIVQRSKEANIPLWLTFPIIFCIAMGSILLFSPSSVLGNQKGTELYWIGVLYMLSGATFTVSALLGWFISAKTVLNLRDKKQKVVAIYLFIIVMVFTIGAVCANFIASLGYSLSIVKVSLSDNVRGNIACLLDAVGSCSNCYCDEETINDGTCTFNPEATVCPQWTSSDVSKIVQTQLKQSVSLAAIFFIYAVSALQFGFSLRKAQSNYQIDYV